MTDFAHRTVLLDEAVQALAVHAGGVYVDGTFGRGGHSRLILQTEGVRLIAFDKDPTAVMEARTITNDKFEIVHGSYTEMQAELAARGVQQVDGVLLDLGVSSPQIDDGARGFSFRTDAPLDMRMDTSSGITAAHPISSNFLQEIGSSMM